MRLQRPQSDVVLRVNIPPASRIKVRAHVPFFRRKFSCGVLTAGIALSFGVGGMTGISIERAVQKERTGELTEKSKFFEDGMDDLIRNNFIIINQRCMLRALINKARELHKKEGGRFEDCLWKAARILDYDENAIRSYLAGGVVYHFSKKPLQYGDEWIPAR
jgi:hypothetical protein